MKFFAERTLGAICDEGGGEVRTGPFGSQLHEADYSEDGTPVVMPKDIIEGRVSERSVARVGSDHVSRLAQHRLMVGDIVYGRRGDIGRQALITEKERGWLCGTGCLRVSLGDSAIEPKYLHYYLREPNVIAQIAQQAVGATMPNLNTSILRGIKIQYPSQDVQRRIASILSAYDNLIENNTRRIAILEEMARRLYEEWFVRFRFPGHKQARMVESELGLVPEGWVLGKLADFVQLSYGKALKSETRIPGPFPVYGSSGVVGFHSTHLVRGPGIIVGRKGNVGSVHWCDTDFYPIDTVYFVETRLPLPYVYFNLQTQNFLNNDAAVPGLNRNQAYSLPFIRPDDETLTAFEDFALPIFQSVRNTKARNTNLRAQRDLLLPKLISGEIDVSAFPEPEQAPQVGEPAVDPMAFSQTVNWPVDGLEFQRQARAEWEERRPVTDEPSWPTQS